MQNIQFIVGSSGDSPNLTMMTSSNGNIFRVNCHLCGEFAGHRWIPCTKSSDAELNDVFFDLRLYKRLSKQSWGWCFDTPSRSLWRHYNVFSVDFFMLFQIKHIARSISLVNMVKIAVFKMAAKWKLMIPVTQILNITDKQILPLNIRF